MRHHDHHAVQSPLAYLVRIPSVAGAAGALTLVGTGEVIHAFNQASSGSDTQYVVGRSLAAGGWFLLFVTIVAVGLSRHLRYELRSGIVTAGTGFLFWALGDLLDGIGNIGYGSPAEECVSSLAFTLGSVLMAVGLVACAFARSGPRWIRPAMTIAGLFFVVDAAGDAVGAVVAYANPWVTLAVTSGMLSAIASLGVACATAVIAASPEVHAWVRPRLLAIAGAFMITGIGVLIDAFGTQQNAPNSISVSAIAIQGGGSFLFAFVFATMAPRVTYEVPSPPPAGPPSSTDGSPSSEAPAPEERVEEPAGSRL